MRLSERSCWRHGRERPCTCAMGHLYRFLEPLVLFQLKKRGHSHGYELSQQLRDHVLTDAEIERAALYRTLRHLEATGNVVSAWDADDSGPARRVYRLTAKGEQHLQEWAVVLDQMTWGKLPRAGG